MAALYRAEKGKFMYKLMINGQAYIKVRTIREEIRFLRRSIDDRYCNFDADHRAMIHLAYNDIIKAIYREELARAKTPEEIDAIMEMPGDFIVTKGHKKEELVGFLGFENGEPIIGDVNDVMFFDYESKAKEVAERLGEGWDVIDMSPEDYERTKRFLNAIFEDDDEPAD